MKKVLIISPHFVPVNTADMHRIRLMLNYIQKYGWCAEVVTVNPKYINSYSIDNNLLKTTPKNLVIHYVKALSYNCTRKFGLGSLSLRSYYFFKKKVNKLLTKDKFDLIFISTTAFHVMALGPYWKRKFSIPFVLDIQDPWRSDFYLDKPKNQRPPKFLISYIIDKFLEAKTVPFADGLISVSSGYIETFFNRYSNFKPICKVIPFAGFEKDFDILDDVLIPDEIIIEDSYYNIIYIGRGGHDMSYSIENFFRSLLVLKKNNKELFDKVRVFFIGTSYAPKGTGMETIMPIAMRLGINNVIEITDRQEYFVSLKILKKANLLFIPGSSDSSYTASKIYPYILSQKPIIAIFHKSSSVIEILKKTTTSNVFSFDTTISIDDKLIYNIYLSILNHIQGNCVCEISISNLKPYMADSMTENICLFFDKILKNK